MTLHDGAAQPDRATQTTGLTYLAPSIGAGCSPLIHVDSSRWFWRGLITNPIVIVYNKNLVPKERVPKTWADCHDPYFKGKLVTLVDASHTVALWGAFGEKWATDFAKKLLTNNPRWVSGNTNSQTLVATGEMLLVCPAGYGSFYRYVKDQPGVPLGTCFLGPIAGKPRCRRCRH
jgi:ABC-type Fe3+ transport system substrate-binding protein